MKKILCLLIGLSILFSSTGAYSYAYAPRDILIEEYINVNNRVKDKNSYTAKWPYKCKTYTVHISSYSQLKSFLDQLEWQINTSKNRLIKAINVDKSLVDKIFIFDANANVIYVTDKITLQNWNALNPTFDFLKSKKYTLAESVASKFFEKIISVKLDPKTAKFFSYVIKDSLHKRNKVRIAYERLQKENIDKYWNNYYKLNDLLVQLSKLIKSNEQLESDYILLSNNNKLNESESAIKFECSADLKKQKDFSKEYEEISKKIDKLLEQLENNDGKEPYLSGSKLVLADSILSKIAYLCTDKNLTYEDILKRSAGILEPFFEVTKQRIDLSANVACQYSDEKKACLVKKIVDIVNKHPEEYKLKNR